MYKLFLVEDDKGIADGIGTLAATWGYDVVCCTDFRAVTEEFATAMIIYYKQISEGHEDKARFDIMQKVGMTKKDIKKRINSQVLTVFFAPLLLAGLHLAFAFPLVWKILQMFSLTNLWFVIGVTVVAFLLFAAFYTLIYKLTARAYYKIVAE